MNPTTKERFALLWAARNELAKRFFSLEESRDTRALDIGTLTRSSNVHDAALDAIGGWINEFNADRTSTQERLDLIEATQTAHGVADLEAIARLGARIEHIEATLANKVDVYSGALDDLSPIVYALRDRIDKNEARIENTEHHLGGTVLRLGEQIRVIDARLDDLLKTVATGDENNPSIVDRLDLHAERLVRIMQTIGRLNLNWVDAEGQFKAMREAIRKDRIEIDIIGHRVNTIDEALMTDHEWNLDMVVPGVEPIAATQTEEAATTETVTTFGRLVAVCNVLLSANGSEDRQAASMDLRRFMIEAGLR